MAGSASLTPMFRQYHALKSDHPNAILLFRMGDFYEMFHDDAKTASRLLELTLTARGKGTDNVVPMCGFPHHQVESYTARLVQANQRVAICDQVEDPRQAKGLVRREVVRLVTPGTVLDPAQLEAKENLWMAAVSRAAGRLGIAFLDGSTGEFLACEAADPTPKGARAAQDWSAVAERLRSFRPREIVFPEGLDWPEALKQEWQSSVLTDADPCAFTATTAHARLCEHFGVASLDGFGFRDRVAAVGAAGGLLQYLNDTQKSGLEHLDTLRYYEPSDFMVLDPATRRNLELDRSLRDGGRRGSVFDTVDETVTPAGGRLLRRWLSAPLLDAAAIAGRQDAVGEFLNRPDLRERAREQLKQVRDIERLLARSVARTVTPRELVVLRQSLERLPVLIEALSGLVAPLARQVLDGVDPCQDLCTHLARAIVDDPPVNIRDGGMIRDGFHEELDELRTIQRDGKSFIAALETREREATGIGSLKVRYNKVFGYFIEVSKPNLRLVPEHYQRKQTIATGERFVTPELKEHESKILNAQERVEHLETELFHGVRQAVAAEASRLKAAAGVSATLDVLSALAESAAVHDYRRPRVDADSQRLQIRGGRHPVVEQFLVDQRFIPNDTELHAGGQAIAVLTGPNMGGKSTYLRQVALIVLLAQSGAFVPAESAELSIVDRIFCRVGASDSLAEGQSTFMVEMTETANILHHASPSSLVLLDEIGRGTSTFDGLSIAWAVVEQLDQMPGGAPRTLFATHYHELTELAVELASVVNLRMAVREWGDDVIFTHRVESGAADRSYGIQVARLAGVPQPVVDRAKQILSNLERDEYGRDGQPRRARRGDGQSANPGSPAPQATLFDWGPANSEPQVDPRVATVIRELRERDPERLTPIEALNWLTELRARLVDEGAD